MKSGLAFPPIEDLAMELAVRIHPDMAPQTKVASGMPEMFPGGFVIPEHKHELWTRYIPLAEYILDRFERKPE